MSSIFDWDYLPMTTGFDVIEDRNMTEPKLEMLEPTPRFVEYDESDWWWLVKYGYARIVQVLSKSFYRMDKMLIMHPDMLAAIKVDPRVMIKGTA